MDGIKIVLWFSGYVFFLKYFLTFSGQIWSLYLISEKLHVAFELQAGISSRISLQALSRKCPLTYQTFLGLELLRQL